MLHLQDVKKIRGNLQLFSISLPSLEQVVGPRGPSGPMVCTNFCTYAFAFISAIGSLLHVQTAQLSYSAFSVTVYYTKLPVAVAGNEKVIRHNNAMPKLHLVLLRKYLKSPAPSLSPAQQGPPGEQGLRGPRGEKGEKVGWESEIHPASPVWSCLTPKAKPTLCCLHIYSTSYLIW